MRIHAFRQSPSEAIHPDKDGVIAVEEGWQLSLITEADLPAQAYLSGVKMRLLELEKSDVGFRQRWELDVSIWAGRSTILVETSVDRSILTLDVSPHGQKLGIARFRAMLEELSRVRQGHYMGTFPRSLAGEKGHRVARYCTSCDP